MGGLKAVNSNEISLTYDDINVNMKRTNTVIDT